MLGKYFWSSVWDLSFNFLLAYSIQNWIEDLFWKQLDLNYPEVSDAMVCNLSWHSYYYPYARLYMFM